MFGCDMMPECPLCTIPQREPLLYQDKQCYIVNTKENKGHKLRVMVVTNHHTETPSSQDFAHCLDRLRSFMETHSTTETFYMVFGTYATVPDHYHIIGCDDVLNLEESNQLFSSEYVRCLVHSTRRKILIGIPAHNEEMHIAEVVEQAKKFGTVYVVNNASEDDTGIKAKDAGAVVTSHNWGGYGRALYEIFQYAKDNSFDILITLDGDGQHNPNEIPRFLTAIQTADIVIGNRFLAGERVPSHRKAVVNGLNFIYGIGDTQCGFRAYSKKAIELIKITEDGMGASLEILNRAKENKLKLTEVPCAIVYDKPEKPFHNLLSQGLDLVNTVFWSGIWARPYTFLGIPALILFIISSITGIQAILLYMSQGRLVGSLALICGITLLSSIALMSITFFIMIQRRVIKELSRR